MFIFKFNCVSMIPCFNFYYFQILKINILFILNNMILIDTTSSQIKQEWYFSVVLS